MSNLILVPFHNQSLVATLVGDIPYVAMKPICENIGIDWESQKKKINRHPVLNKGEVMITSPSRGGIQEMLMLPVKMLNGWLLCADVKMLKNYLQRLCNSSYNFFVLEKSSIEVESSKNQGESRYLRFFYVYHFMVGVIGSLIARWLLDPVFQPITPATQLLKELRGGNLVTIKETYYV